MPFVVIMRSPAMPEREQEELARRANLHGDPPEGLLLHAQCSERDDAELLVEVWDSPEQHLRFVNERLLPAARTIAADAGLPAEVSSETLAAFSVHRPEVVVRLVDDFGDEIRRVEAL